jgi:hypothetical protein
MFSRTLLLIMFTTVSDNKSATDTHLPHVDFWTIMFRPIRYANPPASYVF